MDNLPIRELYEHLLDEAREVARRNRKRIDDLRQRFKLPDEMTGDRKGDENAPAND